MFKNYGFDFGPSRAGVELFLRWLRCQLSHKLCFEGNVCFKSMIEDVKNISNLRLSSLLQFLFYFSKEQLNKCQITNDAFKNILIAKRLLVYYMKCLIYYFFNILSDTALNALLCKINFCKSFPEFFTYTN